VKSGFSLMATYNQWINTSLYDAAATLGDDAVNLDRGAYFGSILGTLNHILVADTIWLKRFAGHPAGFPALDSVRMMDMPQALNQILFPELTLLRQARLSMDATIIRFADELTDSAIAEPLSYLNTRGVAMKKPFGYLLQHFFNHQTHHRGQASTLLYQAGVDIGVTDLLACIPDV